MENNVQTLKNDVPSLKKAGYITEVVTPEALNDNISIAKYVTQVGVASQIKFEDTEEDTPKEPVVADTTPKVDAPKEPVAEESTKTPEVTPATPEEPTKTPEDEIVVDEQEPVEE